YMRLAIIARDGGCAFPGCTAPSPWTEVHHIRWFEKGGPTSTDNGVMLCSHHHHLIHEGAWRIEVINGIAWFFPPPHLDPAQKPLRNHVWLKNTQLPER
ncbi:MAG: HNH endonuclease signature motif containing protein, partial [Actinomycetota bacterium]